MRSDEVRSEAFVLQYTEAHRGRSEHQEDACLLTNGGKEYNVGSASVGCELFARSTNDRTHGVSLSLSDVLSLIGALRHGKTDAPTHRGSRNPCNQLYLLRLQLASLHVRTRLEMQNVYLPCRV